MQISGVKLLTNFPDRDLVTDILRSVTLKTVVLGRAELRTPWGLRYDLPGRAVFHIVLRGQCWLHANGANCEQVNCGDMLLFPSAAPHDISDHPATPIRPLQEMLIRHPMTPDRLFRYGGRGPQTTMLCGAFLLNDPKVDLMGALLPPLLHLRNKGDQASSQLRALTRCIETELKISRPGEQAIVTRMAEAFLLRAIRDHVLASSNGGHGLSAILRDPSIARVLGKIHQRPEHAWTVDSLANEANLSRSGFAARFKLRVGSTPQSYLQRYRFSRAVQLLQTDAKLFDIAQRVGYDSESSFSKAFKRLTGKSPGAYRLAK